MARILIVEDNHDYQELLQNFLENARHEVTAAGDGDRALGLIDALPFRSEERRVGKEVCLYV